MVLRPLQRGLARGVQSAIARGKAGGCGRTTTIAMRRTTRALQAVMDQNDGVVPNALYLQRREYLANLVSDLGGERPVEDVEMGELVKRVMDLTEQTEVKVSEDVEKSITLLKEKEGQNLPETGRKRKRPSKPRWLIEELSPVHLAEMKRILHVPTNEMYDRYQGKDLIFMWDNIGMKYPFPTSWITSKADNIEKMRALASQNLCYHGLVRKENPPPAEHEQLP